MKGTIQVINLSKAYKQYKSHFSRMREWCTRSSQHQLKWILKNISFTVHPGEAVGIIGLNGAGKSTLLKIITGIIHPTNGHVHIHGNIAAMLELGMGFHPHFTGRQNTRMAAHLLGFSEKEITEYMPSIEAFAEIGDAIDHEVNTYSSGMKARLAFSVATAKRPDILIVDEVLSVGDAYFQEKSFERIRQFQKEGSTLLFVSHSKTAIQSICDKAVLLDKGKIIKEGTPQDIMDYYNTILINDENQQAAQSQSKNFSPFTTTEAAIIENIALLNSENIPVEYINVGTSVTLKVAIRIHTHIPKFVFGYKIKDNLGTVIYGTNTHLKEIPAENLQPEEILEYSFSFPLNLGPGSYSISVALACTETHLMNNYQWTDLALLFNVINPHNHFVGCAWLEPNIEVNR